MKWPGLLLALPLLALVPSASADGYCRSSYRASYSYTPTYKAYSYTPTYTYQNAYDYPVYLKAVKAYVSPDYYSSVQDYYRDKLLVDAVAGKTAEVLKSQLEMNTLKQEVESLRRQLSQQPPLQQQAPPQQQYQQAPPQQEQYVPRQEAPRQTMPPANGEQANAEPLPPVPEGLQAVVQTNCLRCHGAEYRTRGKGIDLRDLDRVSLLVRLQAATDVFDGKMPDKARALNDSAVALFHQWATGRKGVALSSQK